MFASFRKAKYSTSLTFLSKAAFEKGVHEKLGLQKKIGVVKNIRKLTKKDMVFNGETPQIDVDPQTYEVKVDGELITCEPDEKVSLAQRYFLF